jgi:hypothetical protein
VAVIKGGVAYVSGAGSRTIGRPLQSIEDVIKLAHALNVWSVWLVDVPTDTHAFWQLDSEQWGHVQRWPDAERDEPLASALYSTSKPGHRRWSVFVCDLSRDHRWPVSAQPEMDAQAWAYTVEHCERLLAVPLRFSPGTTGLRFLREQLATVPPAPASPLPELEAPVANYADPTVIKHQKWWHAFDRNAAYLAAMQSTPLGSGTPIAWRDYDNDQRAPLSARHAIFSLDGYELEQAQAKYPNMARGAGWYDHAIVRALGVQPADLTEGYVWQDSKAYLRTFADTLWTMRATAQESGSRMLLELTKAIYTETYGNLNAQRIGSNALFRPHWHTAIRAESTRRVMADVIKWRTFGAFAAAIDLVLVASDHKDPAKALSPATARRAGLGGYKHVYTVEATDGLIYNVRRELTRRNGGALVAALRTWRSEGGEYAE